MHEWALIVASEDGTEVFVDVSSIRVAGTIRTASIKKVPLPRTTKGQHAAAHKWESHTVTRDAYNCSDATHRFEALTIYYDDGTNDIVSVPSTEPWEAIPPDSMLDFEMRFVCAWKPRVHP